jgi:uncharacterized RmlC-like cupin family protein
VAVLRETQVPMKTQVEPTRNCGVRLVHAADRLLAGAQTPGMIREKAFCGSSFWAGIARTAPGNISGWHHHGAWDTIAYVITGEVRLEYGSRGQSVAHACPGDHLFIPKGEIHRESNPADVEQTLAIFRIGEGPVVIAVDAPPMSADI